MLIYKTFRYRIYPTTAQKFRMSEWENALRFLWNLANEQRRMGLARPQRIYRTAFDQQKELTTLRAELPWLADVSRNVCTNLLVELDKAWQRCFKRSAHAPRWKRRGRDAFGFTEVDPGRCRLDSRLRFPKLGQIRIKLHRPLEGEPKKYTINRDGDQWFVSIVCEIEINPTQRTEPIVAIDRGITNVVADSNEKIERNPQHLERALKRLARAQRTVARRQKGSKNKEKAKIRVMRIHRKVRRQRAHILHALTTTYAESQGTVVVERLQIANMEKNRQLSRRIGGAGWGQLVEMLRYKLAWSGGQLAEVSAHYSSQTCAACGHIDATSRARESFHCTVCGHRDHADVNAAKVLKQRYLEVRANRSCQPVEASSTDGLRNRKVKLRVSRRASQNSDKNWN